MKKPKTNRLQFEATANKQRPLDWHLLIARSRAFTSTMLLLLLLAFTMHTFASVESTQQVGRLFSAT